MTLTENKAKKLWCPEARVTPTAPNGDVDHGAPTGYNRAMRDDGILPMGTRCLASRCMAWRWGASTVSFEGNSVTKETRRGYCGKAGVPA